MEAFSIRSLGLDTCAVPHDASEVTLYAIDVERIAPIAAEDSFLNEAEKARADRFHRPSDAHRFVLARHALRCLLGRYTGSPEAIGFHYGAKGKPWINNDYNGLPVHFNLSHSGRWVLIGLSLGAAVGVDIENQDATLGVEGIAERYFHPAECARLAKVKGGSEKCSIFYRFWVAKEAKAKALGVGLPVMLSENIAPRCDEACFGDGDGYFYFIHHFNGYHACCYVAGEERSLSCVALPRPD